MATVRKPPVATATPVAVDDRAARIAKKRDLVNKQAVDQGMTTADRPLITTLEQRHQMFGKPISTGSILLDFLLGGGWPRGCSTKLWGPEGCLAADTWIDYGTYKNGKKQSRKGGTIERLYKRFNGLPMTSGKGEYRREAAAQSDFYVPSINDKGYVVMNRVMDVIDSGVKPTFTVITKSGNRITATDNHEFFVGNNVYVQLKDLSVGDTVYSHEKHRTPGKRTAKAYPEAYVKYHPSGNVKAVNGYTYYRVGKHRLAYEAAQNGMTYDAYLGLLNTESHDRINTFWTVPKGQDIHHGDGDVCNNDPANLSMMDTRGHAQFHWSLNPHNLMTRVIEDKIVSIEFAGETQVYDIVCAEPYRNFIASGIAVHNCGKSNLAMAAAAGVIKDGGYVLWMQAEDGDPWEMAGTYGIEKDNPRFLVFHCQGSGEQAFSGLKGFLMDGRIPSMLLDLVVVDSLAGLEPKDLIDYDTKKNAAGKTKGAEGSVNPGRVAAMYASIFRYLHSTKALGTAAMIMISQARVDIGSYAKSEISVGGRATDHAARLVVKMKRASGEGMIKVSAQTKEQIGHTNELTFTKDGYRHRLQGRKASFVAYYKKGIDNPTSYFDLLQLTGALIKETSTKYVTSEGFRALIEGDTTMFLLFNGAPKAKAALKDVRYFRAAKTYLENYINSNHGDVSEADTEEELVEGDDGMDFGAEEPGDAPRGSDDEEMAEIEA